MTGLVRHFPRCHCRGCHGQLAALAIRGGQTGVSPCRRPQRRARRGFTLLEVLLVAILSVLLLAGVWSLFDVYTNLFDKGQSRTEQAQLVRSLMRQISDDLRSAIQDTAARPPQMPATTPLRRFGLFGTAQSLQLDIMRAMPDEADFLPKDSLEVQPTEEQSGPKAPEFRTVQYEFVEPLGTYGEETATLEEEKANHSGLTRRELDWEIPSEAERQATATEDTSSDTAEKPADEGSELYVPEVVSIEFRYFDGKAWTSQWNSIERKSLPAAIEVSLQIRPAETPKKRQFQDNGSSEEKGTSEEENSDTRITVHEAGSYELTEQAPPPLPTHRMVVYLPVSPLQSPPKTADTVSSGVRVNVPTPVVPTISVPQPRTPAPQVRPPRLVPAPADQHIRNQ